MTVSELKEGIMDSKLLISIVVVIIVAITFFASSYTSPSSPAPDLMNPTGEYSDYQTLGTATSYRFAATLAGIDSETITFRTSQRVLVLDKPAKTRYYELVDNLRSPITESELIQNERSVVLVDIDSSTNEVSFIDVTVKR